MAANEKIMEVRAIENGTVIDHIPSEALFKIISILKLDRDPHRMTFGLNLESKRMGSKAIIKINDRYCLQEEINRIALVAPMAIVNTIQDFKVTEKRSVTVPQHIEGFVRCANPKCITNCEPVTTAFRVIERDGEIALKCRYCEKETRQSQMELIK
ncbi:MAG: aspartate carbamoyltransferase regulatory subunit [Rikenellaceae bacterium]|nr:aspartate carbamoyltransferase regulatory subunit [Rikenellaceae bacterium]